jgi:mRNA-degrading endonuclease RelE of RelBE toxin-antitoxin system
MSYNIIAVPSFRKELKKLAKKYPSLKNEFGRFLTLLGKEPKQGVHIGNNCYKVRLSIASKGKGKSGGSRIITHLIISEKQVFLIAIYDKSEKENLTDAELKILLKGIDSLD